MFLYSQASSVGLVASFWNRNRLLSTAVHNLCFQRWAHVSFLCSGKQPDWKHNPGWPSGPGIAGMSSSDGLGGSQRGAGNMQRVAPGPAVVPVVQSPGPFDIQMSAPFQVIS